MVQPRNHLLFAVYAVNEGVQLVQLSRFVNHTYFLIMNRRQFINKYFFIFYSFINYYYLNSYYDLLSGTWTIQGTYILISMDDRSLTRCSRKLERGLATGYELWSRRIHARAIFVGPDSLDQILFPILYRIIECSILIRTSLTELESALSSSFLTIKYSMNIKSDRK